jgi:hypothetical protein
MKSVAKMEATCSSETLVDFYWDTRNLISEGRTLCNHRFENRRPYEKIYFKKIYYIYVFSVLIELTMWMSCLLTRFMSKIITHILINFLIKIYAFAEPI